MELKAEHRKALLAPDANIPEVLERIVMEVEGARNDGVVELECLRDGGLRFVGLLWRLGPVRVDLILAALTVFETLDNRIAWGGDFPTRDEAERAWRRGRVSDLAWRRELRTVLSRVYARGEILTGRVRARRAFGVFVDLPGNVYGLVEIPCMKDSDEPLDLSDYPVPGKRIRAIVLGQNGRCVQMSLRQKDFAAYAPEDLEGPSWDLDEGTQ
ncbi:MAG: hypothetical protein H6737_24105 [Alphaproteobacteria bacterium]|nr:hypothetical protein [Alphaproteobacteria bacterium]